jgi:hypothetical protein
MLNWPLLQEIQPTIKCAESKRKIQEKPANGKRKTQPYKVTPSATKHQIMQLKFATLNQCLGLTNKKESVKNLILQENIDLLCLQETEIEINVDHALLSFPRFNYKSEINYKHPRVDCYINSNISYTRRYDCKEIEKKVQSANCTLRIKTSI